MIPNVTTINRLPRLGKVRLGEKRKSASGSEYPAALDHFSFVDAPDLEQIFGDKATTIYPVVLPHDDEEVWFPTGRKAYRASGLFCACYDGERANRVNDPKDEQGREYLKSIGEVVADNAMYELPCPGEDCHYFVNKYCKNIGRFMFMCPQVEKLGVYEITTTSVNSMRNILSTARMVAKLTGGRLAGIPFALHLEPQRVQPPGGKAKTVQVLRLEYRGNVGMLLKQASQLQLVGGTMPALPEADPNDVPEDLYPQGGQALSSELDEPTTPARFEVKRKEPEPEPEPEPEKPKRRRGRPKKEEPELPSFPEGPEPQPLPAGRILDLLQGTSPSGTTVWTVRHEDRMGDVTEYKTVDPKMAKAAEEFMAAKIDVVIPYETTARGARRIIEIAPHMMIEEGA